MFTPQKLVRGMESGGSGVECLGWSEAVVEYAPHQRLKEFYEELNHLLSQPGNQLLYTQDFAEPGFEG